MTDDTETGYLLCWFCPKCETMGLVREAIEAGYCMQEPRRPDCPVPLTGLPIAGACAGQLFGGGRFW